MLFYGDRINMSNGKGFNRMYRTEQRKPNCACGSGIVEDIITPVISFVKDNKDLIKDIRETGINALKIGFGGKIENITATTKPKKET